VKLLNYFLRNPGQAYYVRELTRLTGEHIHSIRRELANLVVFGLLSEEGKDQKKYYRAKENFILYDELRLLFTKADTVVGGEVSEELKSLGDLDVIILTGVFTGAQTKTDLLLAGTTFDRKRLEPLLARFSQKFGKPIRFSFFPIDDYRYRLSITDRFLYDIMIGKKIVVKDDLPTKGTAINNNNPI